MKEKYEIINEKNIRYFDKISKEISKELDIKTVIKGFSVYMAKTNSNYLYNETYMIDHLDGFIYFLRNYILKNECIENLCSSLNNFNLIANDCIIEIYIDNIWKIVSVDKDGIISWEKKISQEVNYNNMCLSYFHASIFLICDSFFIEDCAEFKITEDKKMIEYIIMKISKWFELIEKEMV